MNFNLDPLKQAQEVVFNRKIKQINHPLLFFNYTLVNLTLRESIQGWYYIPY